jgi:hypothetical protein
VQRWQLCGLLLCPCSRHGWCVRVWPLMREHLLHAKGVHVWACVHGHMCGLSRVCLVPVHCLGMAPSTQVACDDCDHNAVCVDVSNIASFIELIALLGLL